MERKRTRRRCKVQSCVGNFRTVRVHEIRSDSSGREARGRKTSVPSYSLTDSSSARQLGRVNGVRKFLAHLVPDTFRSHSASAPSVDLVCGRCRERVTKEQVHTRARGIHVGRFFSPTSTQQFDTNSGSIRDRKAITVRLRLTRGHHASHQTKWSNSVGDSSTLCL